MRGVTLAGGGGGAVEAEGTRGIGLGYLPWYCGHLRAGKIIGTAVPVMGQTAPAVVQVDAADGFGHPAHEAGEAALVAAALAKPLLRTPGDRRHANRARITARGVEALMSQLRGLGA